MSDAKMKIIAGKSHPEFARAVAYYLDVPLIQTEVIEFANQNLLVQVPENVRECDVFYIQTAALPVNQGIMEMLLTIDALRHASAARVTAVIPYFPYARSDKKDQPRISIAARLMADLIQTAGADRVLTMDLHAPQIQGFFRIPVDQLKAADPICDRLKRQNLENCVLVAADVGEAKELGRYANRLDLGIAIIDKRRAGNDDKARAVNIVGDVKGKDCLIVDDEISTAGTLIEAASFLMEQKQGAKSVSAAATHGVFCGPAVEKISQSCLARVLVTDTVPLGGKKIKQLEVLSVTKLFAKAIRRIHSGDSVSELFPSTGNPFK